MSNRIASITPPLLGENIRVLASATSSQTIAIPRSWYRNYVTFQADGADFYLGVSNDSLATVDETSTTTVSSNAFAALAGDECVKIADGSKAPFDFSVIVADPDSEDTIYIVVKASATGGYLRILRSSGPVKPS